MNTTSATARILLVDDHPLVRDGMRMRLEMQPNLMVVGEAGSTEEAFDWLAGCDPRAVPELVLTDVAMHGYRANPRLDGALTFGQKAIIIDAGGTQLEVRQAIDIVLDFGDGYPMAVCGYNQRRSGVSDGQST